MRLKLFIVQGQRSLFAVDEGLHSLLLFAFSKRSLSRRSHRIFVCYQLRARRERQSPSEERHAKPNLRFRHPINIVLRYNRNTLLITYNPDVKLSDYQALAQFRYQIRRFLHFSEEAARQAGIEPQHHQLMLVIKGRPDGEECRIAYLAERLQVKHHSAVELVDRLVRKGLIARARSEQDRREVHVQLTARGERILAELTVQTRAELRSAAPELVATLRDLSASKKARPPLPRRRPRTATAGRTQ